jgi:predicted secreted Zn-dependent protease
MARAGNAAALGRAGLIAALALAAFAAAAAQDAPRPGPLAGIPNLTIEYYDVSGRTPAAIRAALNAVRPRDPNDGLPVDALSRWNVRWSWRGNGRGGCDLANARIEYSARIVMPRLANEADVPPGLRARWRAYVAALETHEAGHVRYPYDRLGEIAAAIRASTCEGANEAARRALAPMQRHDVDYDRATRPGASQGATVA